MDLDLHCFQKRVSRCVYTHSGLIKLNMVMI